MEVNARLQVEHPVTEVTTGLDLVKLQLRLAAGERLEGDPPPVVGHAIEARLNAEDTDRDFAPAPGEIELLRIQAGPGLRIDAGFEEGDVIPAEFDSMIAKVIAHGCTRDEAVARLERSLSHASVLIRGGTTNRAFLQQIVGHPDFRAGRVDVGWIDRLVESGEQRPASNAEVALCHVAILAYDVDEAYERSQFLATAARGRPEVGLAVGHDVELRHLGACYQLHVLRLGPHSYRVEVDGCSLDVEVAQATSQRRRLTIGPRTYGVLSAEQSGASLVEVDGMPHRIARDDGGTVRAPAPCMVVAVLVQAGDIVAAGDALVVLEAMKMETVVRAEVDGRVREVVTRANEQVGAGRPLLVLEPVELADSAAPASRADFATLVAEGGSATLDHDGCAHRARRASRHGPRVRRHAASRAPGGPSVAENRRSARRSAAAGRTRSSACSSTSPRSSAAPRPTTTPTSGGARRRSTCSPTCGTSARWDAASRDCSSISCGERCVTTASRASIPRWSWSRPSTASLSRNRGWISTSGPCSPSSRGASTMRPSYHDDASWRLLLDRIVAETRQRWPGVHDLAQELHYRTFDQSLLEEIRAEAYRQATEHVRALTDGPGDPERAQHIQALVDCSQPLKTALSAWYADAAPSLRRDLLEVMTRRYYRVGTIDDLQTFDADGHAVAVAMCTLDGARIHVVSTHVECRRPRRCGQSDREDHRRLRRQRRRVRRLLPVARRASDRSGRLRQRARAHRGRHDAGAGPPSGHRPLLALGRTRDERRASRHVPSRTRRLRRGPVVPGAAPHDGEASRAVAAAELRPRGRFRPWRTSTRSVAPLTTTPATSGSSCWPRCGT